MKKREKTNHIRLEINNPKESTYLVNRYLDPSIGNFFAQKGLTFDANEWALSELIQWIWRSRIREGKDINIYLPSRRMRNLFMNYFGIEYDEPIISRRLAD